MARIVKFKERRQQIAAKARDTDRRLADRLRQLQAHEAKTVRKRETRRKIIIGAIPGGTDVASPDQPPLARGVDPGPDAARRSHPLRSRCSVVRRRRRLAAAPPATPITARQKNLLARLVEEHPQLAREFGVNPDEPELEELDKAKATSLQSLTYTARRRAAR